jgi:polyhydroxybutyrate depolymerase
MRLVLIVKERRTAISPLNHSSFYSPLFAILFFGMGLLLQTPASAREGSFTLGSGNYDRTIMVGGLQRSYAVHVPGSYATSKPAPVILNFHGGGGNPKSERTISMMDQAADRYGFIAVYPQGTGAKGRLINPHGYTWNAGTCCGWAMENRIDDVGYTNALLDDLEKQFNIDKKRVFATGISNGAMMCYRLACELSNRIAAIAPVAGPMGLTRCSPPRPVSVMHFHGTGDLFAPYAGGKGPRSLPGESFQSVDQTIAFWLKRNNISGQPRTLNRGKAIGYYHGPGADGTEVVLWSIQGGGHTWPGGRFGILGKKFLGELTQDISANDLMWEFFQRHPLK